MQNLLKEMCNNLKLKNKAKKNIFERSKTLKK